MSGVRLAHRTPIAYSNITLSQYADRYQLSSKDEDYQQVKDALEAFYEKHPEEMFPRLATIYLYEKARHPCGYGQVAIIKEILDSLDVQKDVMEATLQTREATAGTFFDECVSDDSDAERNERFKRGEGSIHADWKTRANLFEIINPTLGTLLIKALTYQTKTEPAEEKKQFKIFMSSVQTSLVKSHGKASLYQKQPRFDDSMWRDLRTLNHYHAQGKLAEGLKRIEGRFYVALLRGASF